MADLNNYVITGRITKDAEYKVLASGKGLLTVSVANNIGYGEYKKTLFIKVQQWGERGQNVAPYLTKGVLIGCAGELSTNEWDTKDGLHKTDLVLTTNAIQILSSKNNDSSKLGNENAESDPVF